MDAQAALGAEDYQALVGMLMSSDASTRAQGQGLAKKLTPPEQREFFDFQQQANKGKDATSQRADSNMVSVGNVGIAPEDALVGGQIVRGVAGAVGSGGAVAGAKAVLGHAAGYAKFEVVRHGLVALGVPAPMADAAALVLAGRGGKAAEVDAEAANPDLARIVTKADRPNGAISPTPLRERFPNGLPVEHPGVLPPRVEPTASPAPPAAAPVAAPVASGPVAPAPPVVATASTAAPPPIVESAPSVPRNQLPDQKALNEEALARRRAEYQAKQAAAAVPAKAKLTAAEAPEYIRLIKQGKSHAEAMETIEAARVLRDRLGLTTPTAAETRFPKGMRDGKGSIQ